MEDGTVGPQHRQLGMAEFARRDCYGFATGVLRRVESGLINSMNHIPLQPPAYLATAIELPCEEWEKRSAAVKTEKAELGEQCSHTAFARAALTRGEFSMCCW